MIILFIIKRIFARKIKFRKKINKYHKNIFFYFQKKITSLINKNKLFEVLILILIMK